VIQLSHFSAAVIFSFFAAIVFGITQKNTPREMSRHAVVSFLTFIVGTILAGWAMAILRHFATR